MTPSITITEEVPHQAAFDISTFIASVLTEKHISSGTFAFNFVSEDTIVAVNRSHLKRDYVTDIISYNLGTIDEPDADIYICISQAKRNAKEFHNSYENELKLLIIHGILHVLDYKDYTTEDKAIMDKEQERILATLS